MFLKNHPSLIQQYVNDYVTREDIEEWLDIKTLAKYHERLSITSFDGMNHNFFKPHYGLTITVELLRTARKHFSVISGIIPLFLAGLQARKSRKLHQA